jgi:hypothetical protein
LRVSEASEKPVAVALAMCAIPFKNLVCEP